ncbi:unnamed protein product [Mytilus edulis]|uniref:WSC domain-containing protein n=1 Tax=Mytilus edulis TaxID=6550 RepID=A0A8S3R6R6_MYTED|nr:unnamed protein product [Mytilus edulis]
MVHCATNHIAPSDNIPWCTTLCNQSHRSQRQHSMVHYTVQPITSLPATTFHGALHCATNHIAPSDNIPWCTTLCNQSHRSQRSNKINFIHTISNSSVTQVRYIGCYDDDRNRMLDDQHFSNQIMTLEVCKKFCHGHRYLGLQSYDNCFCGNSLGDTNVYQKKNEGECDRHCNGDMSQICGGQWRNSVYEFITATLPTTTMTTEGHLTVVTAEMTTNGQSVTTTELETLRKSEVTTTDMTISGKPTVTTSQRSKPEASKVTTTEITTLGQLDVITTDMKTSGQLSVTTLKVTEPKASEVTTIKTTPIFGNSEVNSSQPITSLECLCPCYNVVTGKWDFLRGMNLTLDQLREVMKPELDLMKKELSVNKSNTTRMKRSKISAPDNRVSATSVGYSPNVPVKIKQDRKLRSIPDVKHLGCYHDKGYRALVDTYHDDRMTLELCTHLCNKHRYMELQASNECFCDNLLGNANVFQKISDGACHLPCKGNSSQICGGVFANSVYELIPVTVPTIKMTTPGYSTVKTTVVTIPTQSTMKTQYMTTPGHSTVKTTYMTTPGHSTVITTEIPTPGHSTVKTTYMTTPGHSTVKTTYMTTPGHSTVKTTYMTTPGHSTVITTEIPTPGHSTMKTTSMTTPGHSTVKTTYMTTPGHSTVKTTYMTTPGHSTVITTEIPTPRQSTVKTIKIAIPRYSRVTTTDILTLGKSEVTTTDILGRSPGTSLQVTAPRTSEATTIQTTPIFGKNEVTSVYPIIPLVTSVQSIIPSECLCPCSTIGKNKYDFLRGMNLPRDQLREILKQDLDIIKKELSVNKSNTTRKRRSRISAPDDRISATSVGYVGVVFICFIGVLVVFFDILGCFVVKFKRRSSLQL